MRALCGAIIAAGALIGLGLVSLGIGTRYASYADRDKDGNILFVQWRQLDTPLMIILVAMLICVCIGLAAAFLGLAYHHERRHREHQLALQQHERPRGVAVS